MYAWELKDFDPTEDNHEERNDEEPNTKKQKIEAKRVRKLVFFVLLTIILITSLESNSNDERSCWMCFLFTMERRR